LELAQLAQVRLDAVPRDDPRRAALESWLHVESAFALSRLGDSEPTRGKARTELGRARDGWTPPNPHAGADMDLITAPTQLHPRRARQRPCHSRHLSAVWRQGTDRREGVVADITLARVNVRAGEPTGLRTSADAIKSVRPLRSGLAREVAATAVEVPVSRGPVRSGCRTRLSALNFRVLHPERGKGVRPGCPHRAAAR
jgi:hypothetical protein